MGAFGHGRSKNANGIYQRKHAGCDLYADEGTEVLAVKDGTVVGDGFKFFDIGTFQVIIDHGDFLCRYTELNNKKAPNIEDGKFVKQGQVIGYIGKTTVYHQPMLHFEMYRELSPNGLTDKNNPPYKRRKDLLDPTVFLNSAEVIDD